MGIMTLIQRRREEQSRAAELLKAERNRRKALEKQLKREATTYQRLIVQRLNQLNLCYRYKKKERDWWESGIQSVRFLRTAAGPEAIYIQVDTRRIPRGISLSQLDDDDVLRNLSSSCQRPVKAQHGKDGHDFWYVVERLAGVGGIPANVVYEDMIACMPKTAGPLVIPIGMGANKRQVFASLDDMEQILIGGARGQGKSNFMDSMICTLIQRNPPERLKMIMIDLKIVELTKYTRIPHLLQPVVVDEDGVMPALRMVFNEIQRRMKMFRPDEETEPVCINIQGWNYKFPNQRLPYWLVIIDEMAEVTAVGGDDALFLLQRIGALGRAAGVYGALATQRPSSSIVPGEIKAHYPTRIAFSCADGPSSMTLVDNYDAVRLPGPGHFIFGYRDQRIHLKAPWLGPKLVEKIVKGIREEKPIFEKIQIHNVTAEEMFHYAILNFDGAFSYRKIYKAFRKQGVAQKEVRTIAANYEVASMDDVPEDKQIDVGDGWIYALFKADGGKGPRRLMRYMRHASCVAHSQGEGHPEIVETAESVAAPQELQAPEIEAEDSHLEIPGATAEEATEPDSVGAVAPVAATAAGGNGDCQFRAACHREKLGDVESWYVCEWEREGTITRCEIYKQYNWGDIDGDLDEERDTLLLGALDLDANGETDLDCETCRAANDGWCPGTCETIRRMNERMETT